MNNGSPGMNAKQDHEGHIVTQPYALCWLCTSSNRKNNMILIFSIEGIKEHLCEKISKYTPFKVEVHSNLSAILCKACVLNINNWHGFIEYCIKAQQDLKMTASASCNETNGRATGISPPSTTALPEPVDFFPVNTQSHVIFPDLAKDEKNHLSQIVSTDSECFGFPANESGSDSVALAMNVKPNNFQVCTALVPDVTAYVPSAVVTAPQEKQASLTAITPLVVVPSEIINPNKPILKPQGTYCCAKWCRNNAGEHPNMSCFRVPKNKARAEVWLKNAGREDLLQGGSTKLHTKYLCQEHFTKDMFTNSNCNRLVWNAVPTLFPEPKTLTTYLLDVPQATLKELQPSPGKAKRKLLPKTAGQSKLSSTTPIPSTNYKYILPAPVKTEEKTVNCNVSVQPSETKSDLQNSISKETEKVLSAPAEDMLLATETQDSLMTEANQSFITTEVDMLSLEPSEPKYTCTFCGEMFLMRSSLIMHQTTYHPDHRVGCEICGQVEYHSRAEFLEHVCGGHSSAVT